MKAPQLPLYTVGNLTVTEQGRAVWVKLATLRAASPEDALRQAKARGIYCPVIDTTKTTKENTHGQV